MQQAASQQPSPNFRATGNTRSTIIAILALLLFALSGLMTGFATGAFTRPKQTAQQSNKDTKGTAPTAVVPKQTPSPSATSTPQVIRLGIPTIQALTPTEKADGTTSYTLTAYPVDKGSGNQVHAANITCKIWLTKDKKATETLLASQDKLRSIDTVSQVLPTEIDKALAFSGTPQTQMCNTNSVTTWTYTISPDVEQGKYFIMVLTDWKGSAYNWRALEINVKKAD